MSELELLVVYKQPSDYPDSYVMRRHVVTSDGKNTPDPRILAQAKVSMGDTALAAVRLPATCRGLVRTPRQPADDPCILEVWL